MVKKFHKMIPYLVLVVLGMSSYFFDLPLFMSIFIMGITLYAVYKCFTIINLPNKEIIINEDGIEYRGITYSHDLYSFEYSEFMNRFLGLIPLQEDYYFWIFEKNGELVMKINCILYDISVRNELAKLGT